MLFRSTLAQLGISLRLERRGGRIGLRGPLPLRQGQGNRVQRLSLGLPATEAGLESALAQLRLVAAQLEVGGFQWLDWTVQRRRQEPTGGNEPRAAADPGRPAPAGAKTSPTPGATRNGDVSGSERPEPERTRGLGPVVEPIGCTPGPQAKIGRAHV